MVGYAIFFLKMKLSLSNAKKNLSTKKYKLVDACLI